MVGRHQFSQKEEKQKEPNQGHPRELLVMIEESLAVLSNSNKSHVGTEHLQCGYCN